MKFTVCFWIVGLILITRDVKTIRKSGPFNIAPNRLAACIDKGTDQVHFGGRMSSKGNRVLKYTNNVTFGVPFDDQLQVDVEIQQLNNGAYTPRFLTHRFKNCESFYKYGRDMIESFFGAAGYNITKCPIPVGTYFVKDWEINIQFNLVPVFVYGSYKSIVNFFKGSQKVGCFLLYVDVSPK